MTVIVPFDRADESGTIAPLASCQAAARIVFGETGQIESVTFEAPSNLEESGAEYCIIQEGDHVDVSLFSAYGMGLLQTPAGSDIDAIHEGMLFRQLREVV